MRRAAGLLTAAVVLALGAAAGCSDGSVTVDEPVTLVCGVADPTLHERVRLYSIIVTQRLPPHMVVVRSEGEFELVAFGADGERLDAVTFDFPPDPNDSRRNGGGDITWDRSFCVALRADLPGLARVQVRTESRVDTDAVFVGDLKSGVDAGFALQVRGVRVSGEYENSVSFLVGEFGAQDRETEYVVSYRAAGSERWVETSAEIHWVNAGGTAQVPPGVLAQEFQLRVQVRYGGRQVAAESPFTRVE